MMVNRLARILFLVIFIICVFPIGEALCASSPDEPIVWKHASRTRANGFVNVLIRWYYDQVEKRTKGRLKIKYYWNGTLVPQNEIPNGLKAGISQSTLFNPVMYRSKMPLINVSCLPFMNPMDRKKSAVLLMELMKHPAIQAEFARWDAMLLAPNSFGQEQYIGTKPIKKTEDLKGMRISAHSGYTELLKRFNGVNVIIPSTETYDGLQKGIIDGSISSDGMFNAFRLFEVTKYATRLNITGMISDFVCKKSAFDALPADIQQVMREVSQEALVYFPEQVDKFQEKSLETYKQNGLEITFLPAEERAKLQKAAEELEWSKWVEQYEKQGLPAREIMEFYLTKKKEIAPD